MITTYTTYADVRAVIGVSEDEVEDATLALSLYDDKLALEMLEISPNLPALYTLTSAIAEGSRTTAQKKLMLLTRLFATYQVARHLGIGLPMAGPKSISDGKASMSRFAGEPYKQTLAALEENFQRAKQQLSETLADLGESTNGQGALPFLTGAAPAVDRVTNA